MRSSLSFLAISPRLTVCAIAIVLLPAFQVRAKTISIELAPDAKPRVEFGASRVAAALQSVGLSPTILHGTASKSDSHVIIGNIRQERIQQLLKNSQLKISETGLR